MLTKADWIKGVAHWREGQTAMISVAFTWRLPEVRKIADYYRAIGCAKVKLGGPGTFTMRKYIAEHLADLELGGSIPGRIFKAMTTIHRAHSHQRWTI